MRRNAGQAGHGSSLSGPNEETLTALRHEGLLAYATETERIIIRFSATS